MLTEVLAPIADDALRAEVEARVLARAGGKTVSALRVAAKRAVLLPTPPPPPAGSPPRSGTGRCGCIPAGTAWPP